MSDDEADPELLELLRQTLGIGRNKDEGVSSDTKVLKDAEYVYNNAIDVSIDMVGTQSAARSIHKAMQERNYTIDSWGQNELHPKASEGFSELDMINFIFTMDLLNFSFWSILPEGERFQVKYRGKRWTGYNSLVACLRRALDNNIPITTPRFWNSPQATDENLKMVFFSATNEQMPLLDERIELLREAGMILHKDFGDPPEPEIDPPLQAEESVAPRAEAMDIYEATSSDTTDATDKEHTHPDERTSDAPNEHLSHLTLDPTTTSDPPQDTLTPPEPPKPDLTIVRLITRANNSAGKLVNLLVKHFPIVFLDQPRFDSRRIHLLKRAQILVADLWAALRNTGHGHFTDIDHITMFADYRVPQMLHALGVLNYSPPLTYWILDGKELKGGDSWEVQLRACSIWAVELIRREIVKGRGEGQEGDVSAVLIDFFLYDLAKERERAAGGAQMMPHHRTRSIWY